MANIKILESDVKYLEVCERIATTQKGIITICKELKVSSRYFYEWLERDESNLKRYAHAREKQADLLVEEMIAIADDSRNDLLGIDENGNRIENKEFVNRSRLRVDTRKWIAAKLRPKTYGDQIKHDISVHVEQPLLGE